MTENVSELSAKKFDEFTKSGLVFVDFFAEWCMPCVMMAPIVEEVSNKFKKKIKFGKINVSENEAISRKFDVSSIPNFVLFKDGKPVEQFVGAMDAEELENRLKKFV
jgi:thioredoxin 1